MTTKALSVYRTYFPDPPGGLQEAIRQICLSTARLNVVNSIFTLSPENTPSTVNFPEANVFRSRSWCAPASCDIGGLDAFKSFALHAKGADVIQYHFPWPFIDLLHWADRPKVPRIAIYHSDIIRQRFLSGLYQPLMMKTLQDMDAIVTTSQAYAEGSSVLNHPSIQNKVQVIPLGIDEASYSFEQDDKVFDRLKLKFNEPYFLFLGVMRYYKGVHTLIEAARKLKAKIVLAGAGPLLESVQKQVLELGLNNVVFAGQISHEEKIALIKHCCALVLPSHLRSEAFGMVLLEASMMQKPMISCEIGTGTSYVNQHQETGLVIPPNDAEKLAEAMCFLLDNPDVAEKMGKAARVRYEIFFSGPVLGQAYVSLYNQLI
jgi:glycosyltransferase involved in cell wall biosynthesis